MKQDRERLVQHWREEEARPFVGFDFSYLQARMIDEEPPWDYAATVASLMASARAALDLGTGGGERLAGLAGHFPRQMTATEGHPPNVVTAHARLEPLGVHVVVSQDSLTQVLPFADGTFDLIINRHTAFNAAEVARVLQPRGQFITQQVDGRNLDDLAAAFDSGNPWPDYTLDFARQHVEAAGLSIQQAQAWSGHTIFKDVGALVYYLHAIPWIVDGFSVEKHLPNLLALHARLEEAGELRFARRLFWLQAQKTHPQ